MNIIERWCHERLIKRTAKLIAEAKAPEPVEYSLPSKSLYGEDSIWHMLAKVRASDIAPYPLLPLLLREESLGCVRFDITFLDCLAMNDLGHWTSLNDVAFRGMSLSYSEGRCIRFATDADFQHNTDWFKRCVREYVTVAWNAWDGRFHLGNDGTGHHTAAIYRQCLSQERTFKFPAVLYKKFLDPEIVRQIEKKFIAVCSATTAFQIFDWIDKCSPQERPLRDIVIFDMPYLFDGQQLKIIELDRENLLFPSILAWLRKNRSSFVDVSSMISAAHPLSIERRAFELIKTDALVS